MRTTEKQKYRIMENIYDIINQSQFEKQARKEMAKDLRNKNITWSGDHITIENSDGTIIQYTITIN